MKIYEIGTGYTPIPAKMGAATEIVVEELTKSLKKNKVDVNIVDIQTKNRKGNKLPIIEVPVPKIFTGTDVQLGIMHKFKRVVYSINLALKLKKIIRGENVKVVLHFHNQYNMFFFLMLTSKSLRKKCFIAYTNHSYIWHNDWEKIKKTVNRRYFQEVISMRNADMVYALNEQTINTLINYIGIKPDRIRMIDNGVNTDIYIPLSNEEKRKAKRRRKLENKNVYIQVGSVCDRKNQLGAIQLLQPILKKDKNSCFIYIGGIISEEYQRRIREYSVENNIEDQIIYMGEVEPGMELNEYYNLADAMIFPSKSEGFSLVIIEAMAAGVPVIINQNLHFKLAEECLRYNNNNEFVAIIKERIRNEENRNILSEKIRKLTVENYSWDKVAGDYLKSWEKQ